MPQVLPLWMSFSLYRFESNVHSATVLGLVGAGGIGQVLFESIRGFYYGETAAILIVIVLTVTLVDLLSQQLRKLVISWRFLKGDYPFTQATATHNVPAARRWFWYCVECTFTTREDGQMAKRGHANPRTEIKVGRDQPSAGAAIQIAKSQTPKMPAQATAPAEAKSGPLPPELQVIDAPEFYASSLQGFWVGSDFVLVLTRPRPAVASGAVAAAALVPAAVLHLSAATAKDLSLLMQEQVSLYEQNWGGIETEFSRRVAEKK